jgi:NADH:ubiquinone oxidoreductase subunit 6 (subunit J)
MSIHSFIFYSLEFLAAVSAICILFTKNVFYGALLLIVCLLSVAGIYILTNAEFIAVTQILIYAGGVLVLIIFGVMLTSKISGKPLIVNNQNWFAGSLVGLSFLILLFKLFYETNFYTSHQVAKESNYHAINQIGILTMTDYVLPFEVAGILLLVALIGAAVVASSFHSIKKS